MDYATVRTPIRTARSQLTSVNNGELDVDKCIVCQHYDRQRAKPGDAKGVQWGQCRRSAPMLNPVNAKSYIIEGVWPHVRDDDWCGDLKVVVRREEPRQADVASGPLVSVMKAPTPLSPRPVSVSTLHGNGSSYAMSSATSGVGITGRAD